MLYRDWRCVFLLLLDDMLKEFRYDMKIRNLTPRTIKTSYNSTAKFFKYCKEEFRIEDLDDLKSIHIKSYVEYLQKLKRSEVYINSILKYLKAFFKYCVQEEYILERKNPMKKLNWVKEEKTLIETFNDREVYKMLKVWNYKTFYNARNKAIIAMLIETGIRNLELCTLSLTSVRDSVIKVMGKGRKERYVPISPRLKKILIKYERIRTEYIKDKFITEDAYFLSYRGKRLTIEAVERVVKETGKKANIRANIRCSPHTCRHYYAQFMLKQNVDIYTVSRLLGHSSIDITKIYLRTIRDKEIVEMNNMVSPLMLIK